MTQDNEFASLGDEDLRALVSIFENSLLDVPPIAQPFSRVLFFEFDQMVKAVFKLQGQDRAKARQLARTKACRLGSAINDFARNLMDLPTCDFPKLAKRENQPSNVIRVNFGDLLRRKGN